MKSEELIERARNGEVIGNGSAQINALLAAYDSLLNGQDWSHQWYAVRWKRLHELIKSDACHIEEESCNIMANGTATSMEPPKYDWILNTLRHKIDRLRLYERAMQSMAAQFICPKHTAESLAKMQLGELEPVK